MSPEEEAQIRDDARATPDAPLRPGWAARHRHTVIHLSPKDR